MENSPRLAEAPGIRSLLAELDKLTEQEENRCVQLSWMAYDLVKLRTQMRARAQELSVAWDRCKAAVQADPQPDRKDGAQDADAAASAVDEVLQR